LKKPAIQILLELLSHFPIKAHYVVGSILGFFVTHIPNQISRQTDSNIRLCFDGLSRSKQLSLAKNSIRQTCYSLTEAAAVSCWPAQKILATIQLEAVCEEFNQSNKGRLVIAPHLGSWELLNIWLAENGPLISLYKPQRNQKVDRFIFESRSRNGAQLVPADASGLRKIIKGLKRGETVMILPDQKPRRSSAQIDSYFFGHAASTTPLIQNICAKLDCDVFIGVMYRLETTSRFSLSIESLDHHKLAAPDLESAQYLNDQIESRVRRHPDQYQWGYARFTRAEYETL
jgi:KDO2-lipid IV(A) lauroyltransferase